MQRWDQYNISVDSVAIYHDLDLIKCHPGRIPPINPSAGVSLPRSAAPAADRRASDASGSDP